ALRAEYEQAARLDDTLPVALGLLSGLLQRFLPLFRRGLCDFDALLTQALARGAFRVGAVQDVDATPRHVGCDGHATGASGLSDDFSLALVVFRVQNLMGDARALQRLAQALGSFNRYRADEDGLAARLPRLDLFHDRLEFGFLGHVDQVFVVLADQRAVGRNGDHFQPVNLLKLFRF